MEYIVNEGKSMYHNGKVYIGGEELPGTFVADATWIAQGFISEKKVKRTENKREDK